MAEKLSVVMARKKIERADVAVIVIDGPPKVRPIWTRPSRATLMRR